MTALAYRAVFFGFVLLWLVAVYSQLGFLCFGSFESSWVLLTAVTIAAVAAARRIRPPEGQTSRAAPSWMTIGVITIVGTVTVAVTWGAIATPARHWDGLVAWEVKADFLTRTPTIGQDYFSNDAVYCHSRDYPLLQPTLISLVNRSLGDSIGRGVFGALLLLLVVTTGMAVRLRTPAGWLGPAIAAALAVTPALVNPSMGGADSGFGELFLATCIAGIAAALALSDATLLFGVVFVSIFVKPEALLYGGLPIAITWCRAERDLLRSAVIGWCLGAAIWLPLQHRLQHGTDGASTSATVWTLIAIAALATLILGSHALLRNARRARRWLAIAVVPLSLIALPMLARALGGPGGTATVYLEDPTRPLERLSRLPDILLGFLDHAFGRLDFALAFVLPIVALALTRRKSDAGTVRVRWFALTGLACVIIPFLLSPEEDLRHHLRSSMTRHLIPWLGPLWIVTGLQLSAAMASAPEPPERPLPAANP